VVFKMFSIGDLSKQTGVKIPTIRYYERIGLINSSLRSAGNQRRYRQAHLERLSFIRHARELGFTLKNIRELVAINHDQGQTCSEIHNITTLHLKSVKQRIAKLKLLERELRRIEVYCEKEVVSECRIIQALADHSLCDGNH
jgi:DNA-binding transcriptional MerR regulator